MNANKEVATNLDSSVTGRPKKDTTTTIRISEKTKRRIDVLVKKINTKSYGKHVKPDAIIMLAITNFSDDDIKKIQSTTISGKDRFEDLFRVHSCRKRGINRDEFLDQILCGKVELSIEK